MTIVEWPLYSEFEVDKSLSASPSSGILQTVLKGFGGSGSANLMDFHCSHPTEAEVNHWRRDARCAFSSRDRDVLYPSRLCITPKLNIVLKFIEGSSPTVRLTCAGGAKSEPLASW